MAQGHVLCRRYVSFTVPLDADAFVDAYTQAVPQRPGAGGDARCARWLAADGGQESSGLRSQNQVSLETGPHDNIPRFVSGEHLRRGAGPVDATLCSSRSDLASTQEVQVATVSACLSDLANRRTLRGVRQRG